MLKNGRVNLHFRFIAEKRYDFSATRRMNFFEFYTGEEMQSKTVIHPCDFVVNGRSASGMTISVIYGAQLGPDSHNAANNTPTNADQDLYLFPPHSKYIIFINSFIMLTVIYTYTTMYHITHFLSCLDMFRHVLSFPQKSWCGHLD